jgi:hypothetical protein
VLRESRPALLTRPYLTFCRSPARSGARNRVPAARVSFLSSGLRCAGDRALRGARDFVHRLRQLAVDISYFGLEDLCVSTCQLGGQYPKPLIERLLQSCSMPEPAPSLHAPSPPPRGRHQGNVSALPWRSTIPGRTSPGRTRSLKHPMALALSFSRPPQLEKRAPPSPAGIHSGFSIALRYGA